MWPYRHKVPRLLPPKLVQISAGPAIDLSDLRDRPVDVAGLRIATDRLMTAITGLLEQIRGEQAPSAPFDPRTATRTHADGKRSA